MLSKSLNPLTTDSMINLVLWPLMYDCLAEPDASYTPQNNLASSIDNKGTTVTVQLKNAKFSDGTALSAKDVKYSFEQVMSTPASFFYQNVKNIDHIDAKNSSTVIFYLKIPDTLFANLLDIPIIKYGSAPASAAGTTPTAPIGTGRYVFSTDNFNGTLSANKNWYKGTALSFQTITLVNTLAGNTTFSSLKIGGIDYLFTDYGSGSAQAVGLSSKSVNLNRIVFLSVNSQRSAALSDAHVRKAISLAIDRKSIVADIYSTKALATHLPFNPAWNAAVKPSDADIAVNYTAAENELTNDGYTVQGTSGTRSKTINGTATQLSFKLLASSSNASYATIAKKIINSLAKTGVSVTLDLQSPDIYASKLAGGDFDLCLSELSLTDDMDLSPFFVSGGSASVGIASGSQTASAFSSWRSGSSQLQAVADAFNSETPFIPICYRTGTVSFTSGLSGSITPTYFNIFYGIENWHF